MKQNVKQNKVPDEQIIVAKLRQKSLSDKNQVPLWIKRMISLWTAIEINLAMFTVCKWEYQIYMKQMQILVLRFFYFNDDF